MREVKIKITKRELEELMERAEMRGLSMEQVLARLINSGDNFEIMEIEDHHHHHRSWKPALQSIPEPLRFMWSCDFE
ncbi:hypothetical protein GH714_000779 [Hevea brasiliensis]|uniref:Uncharacterized protein n=1 Tax=Hevea brasiliensis TaxID=3981 RepID=A0A6A6LXK8_HEVBR|nr:hypothetical protein GH714_000779 [Hevea brasiliensis]